MKSIYVKQDSSIGYIIYKIDDDGWTIVNTNVRDLEGPYTGPWEDVILFINSERYIGYRWNVLTKQEAFMLGL